MEHNSTTRILLVPLDPVHDVAVKIINRKLLQRHFDTLLLEPDLPIEEICATAVKYQPDFLLVSRTIGYGVGELLSKFIDQLELAGIRQRARIILGGKAIKPELAAELGFDAGFGSNTDYDEVVAFIEGREFVRPNPALRVKKDISRGYTYRVQHAVIRGYLETITDQILQWASDYTSPGVERANLVQGYLQKHRDCLEDVRLEGETLRQYLEFCDDVIQVYYQSGTIPKTVKKIDKQVIREFVASHKQMNAAIDYSYRPMQFQREKPLVFVQYGTGCPLMDIEHIKACENWGADGIFHFDPAWGARTEGFMSGYLGHEADGTILTKENLASIKNVINDSTIWSVRAHRGLNTPETVVLAGELGADLTKINIVYGSLNGGTDPARLTVDGVKSIKLAAEYGLPFDVVTNEELGGVPAFKAFAGMLIVSYLALKCGARPILKPLFCYSPDVMIQGYMEENYLDYNAAKILALRSIIDAPIWPGEPIGFMTHSEERVQSAMATALHALLSISLDVDAITIASTDEAYSRGPISAHARLDTLNAVREVFRFWGSSQIQMNDTSLSMKDHLCDGIEKTLKAVCEHGDFVSALNTGLLGTRQDGANPGRAGRNTLIKR
ncbi:MAG: cobalamin-binding protein [Candidatus Vecturithrix sp.]|jgi:methylmalonyl-CoA mutase cobalamin-binding subunit|nr:cobalamin-binding protein [Candidatus Vecturithrix sp.]